MTLVQRIHSTETDLFATVAGAHVEESFLELARTGLRVRRLSYGSGPPLVLLHGVSHTAAVWAPLFDALSGWRLLAVDLPGHGLSDPAVYRAGHVLRPENARTVVSLKHAIDHFRRPRTESVLTTPELEAIATPTMFIWGTDAPYLSAERARPSIDQIPTATLHVVPGGHGPWLADTQRSADLIHTHLTSRTPTSMRPDPQRQPCLASDPRN